MFKMCRIYVGMIVHMRSTWNPCGIRLGSMLDPCGFHVGSMRDSWVIHLVLRRDRIGKSPKVLSRNFKLC